MHEIHYWWGMHWVWWVLWIILLVWIFISPFNIPGRRRRRTDTAMDILQKRYASGEINTQEYEERKKILENN